MQSVSKNRNSVVQWMKTWQSVDGWVPIFGRKGMKIIISGAFTVQLPTIFHLRRQKGGPLRRLARLFCFGKEGGWGNKRSLAQVNNTNQDLQVLQWAASLDHRSAKADCRSTSTTNSSASARNKYQHMCQGQSGVHLTSSRTKSAAVAP